MTNNHVAVLDIGKTNVKVALFDLQSGSEIVAVSRPNIVVEEPPGRILMLRALGILSGVAS